MKLYSVPEGLDFVKNLLHVKKKKKVATECLFLYPQMPFYYFF
jgi:hypothetical protein